MSRPRSKASTKQKISRCSGYLLQKVLNWDIFYQNNVNYG
jgi:hypothetical protein